MARTYLKISSIMKTGMYKGHSIRAIIRNDPEYLAWYCRNNYIMLGKGARTLLSWALHEKSS